MYNITPIEYLASLAKTIVLTNTTKTDNGKYWIAISKINGLTFDIFEGREFDIYKSGNNIASGAVKVEYQKTIDTNGNKTQWLVFPNNTYSTYQGLTVIAYGTFQIQKDNQAITLMDIYQAKALAANIDAYGNIIHSGKPGIVSGIDLSNIRQFSKRFYLLNDNQQLNNSNIELCRLKINPGFMNQYRVICFRDTYCLNLDLRIKKVSDTNYINSLLTESTGKDITVKFSVSIQKYTDGTEWAVLVWKSADINITGFSIYAEVPSLEYTKPVGSASGSMISLTWNNNGDTTNGLGIGSLIEIPITQELSYVDNKSIKFTVYVGETNHRHLAIKTNQNLNTLVPGKFYYTPEALDVTGLINIPTGLTDKFTIQCNKTNLTDIRATYILMTKTSQIYYGYLENNLIKWSTPSLVGHTHQAKDIITDSTHRYVTDAWIAEVNQKLQDAGESAKNTLWKSPAYPTKGSLPTSGIVQGTNVVVSADESNGGKTINYLYDGSQWVPTSVNSLEIVTLTNGSGLMSSDMLKRLNAVEKQFMMQFGTNWQRLENTQSTHLSGKNNVLDFVNRGSSSSGSTADNSIIFGNGNVSVTGKKSFIVGFDSGTLAGEYNVALGQGLRNNTAANTNVTLFGKFNDDGVAGLLFAYGIGTSDTDRKNAFWIDKSGDEYFATIYSGYKIFNKGSDDILLADGTTFSRASIPTYEEIMNRVMAYLEAALGDQTVDIVHFLDYSGKTYDVLPIIQQRWKNALKYFVESWTEFKSRAAELGADLLGKQIYLVGYRTANDGKKYEYMIGGISPEDEDGNPIGEFTKQNEGWCVLDENLPAQPSLPAVGSELAFEGSLITLSSDGKLYRFNDGVFNSSGANTWQYFGETLYTSDEE